MATATATAPALTDSYDAVTHEWVRAQSVAEAALRKAQAGVVCRRTWPCDDGANPRHLSRLSDSTRDLRQGLSVVEVFTSSPEAAVDFASNDLAYV
jgi:hypothetical protein